MHATPIFLVFSLINRVFAGHAYPTMSLLTHRVLCVKFYANAKTVKYPGTEGPEGNRVWVEKDGLESSGYGYGSVCMGQRAGLRRAPSKAMRESKQTNNRINR